MAKRSKYTTLDAVIVDELRKREGANVDRIRNFLSVCAFGRRVTARSMRAVVPARLRALERRGRVARLRDGRVVLWFAAP